MERSCAANGYCIVECPYCGKNHEGRLDAARIVNPRSGVINVLSTLPCGNKIMLFFSASHQLRGQQPIDEIDIVGYPGNGRGEIPTQPLNYNDEYKRFAEQRGMQRRLMDSVRGK